MKFINTNQNHTCTYLKIHCKMETDLDRDDFECLRIPAIVNKLEYIYFRQCLALKKTRLDSLPLISYAVARKFKIIIDDHNQ